jgi:hypothetical protein
MRSGDSPDGHADDELGGSRGRAPTRRGDLVPSGKAGGSDQQVNGVAPAQAGCECASVIEALDEAFHDLHPACLKLLDNRHGVRLCAGQGK